MKGCFRHGSSSGEGDLPLHQSQSAASSHIQMSDLHAAPTTDLLFLLLCHDEGRYATRLVQLDLFTLQASSDQALFRILRHNYHSMRGRWLSKLSLRTLVWIKFVYFEMHRSDLVDVRKIDDMPPPENADYKYAPAPPDAMPPIGYKHMIHLFHSPECASADSICLSRFPKKLREQLKCCPIKGVNPGWRLQFVEGWDTRKIWIIIFVVFGLGSLVVAILLTVFERSMQDAFAVSAYMVTMATVSIGFVQALLM